jgi:hypothetical protein
MTSFPVLLSAASDPSQLADDVRFSSPFADYRGRADVGHLFSLIGRVMGAPSVVGTATDGVWTYTSLSGRVGDRDCEAVVRERLDHAGRLAAATLYLRPYASLRAAMAAMGALLAESPLPSTRS